MSYVVVGKDTCPYTQRARNILSAYSADPVSYINDPDGPKAARWRKLKPRDHDTVPWVFDPDNNFIGGFTETQAYLRDV